MTSSAFEMKKNSQTLGEAFDAMIAELKMDSKINEARIRNGWEKIMGKPIAKYTGGISLKKGKLYLKIDSPALKQELSYSKEKIKELFNQELRANVISEVLVF